ncbi:hypothetical protein P3S68_015959 [Capsicum galapagoense]
MESKFGSLRSQKHYSAIWIRLPKLRTEYYDHQILSKIGSKIEKLIKTDICSSATLRERYARIYVEVFLGIPVKTHVLIGNLRQQIVYEGADILCNTCGVIGHTKSMCTRKPPTGTQTAESANKSNVNTEIHLPKKQEGEVRIEE